MRKTPKYKSIKSLFLSIALVSSAIFSCFSTSATRHEDSFINYLVAEISGISIYMRASRGWISSPANPSADIAPAWYIDSYCSYVDKILIDSQNNKLDSDVPSATRLLPATPFFNCHSYAWYSQQDSNQYWLENPSMFYSGEGYIQTSSPKAGDIICYMSGNYNVHSGIIAEVLSSSSGNLGDKYIVESKWGAGGVYRHNGYECPYTSYQYNLATSIRFYTRTSHTHAHTIHRNIDHLSFHESKCSCGQIIRQSHVWILEPFYPNGQYTPAYVPVSVCRDCGKEAINPVNN